jgi:cytochrome c peroxidase
LFFEPGISADGRTSCATCHQPALFFTDGRPVSRGVFGRTGARNAPTILNRAYGRWAFWDGRASTLEEQVAMAIAGETDLGSSMEAVVAHLGSDSTYRRDFVSVFGEPPTARGVRSAIATFMRTQLSGDSAFDRYVSGEKAALGAEERRGVELFNGRARCSRCHSGPLFSDEEFHNTGAGASADPGRFAVTGDERDRGRFKTPSLRNVADTGPYMHDGSIARLADVVDFYDRGGSANRRLDDDLQPLHLSAREKAALVAFLRSLSTASTAKSRR